MMDSGSPDKRSPILDFPKYERKIPGMRIQRRARPFAPTLPYTPASSADGDV
jgi:hypothetical protein